VLVSTLLRVYACNQSAPIFCLLALRCVQFKRKSLTTAAVKRHRNSAGLFKRLKVPPSLAHRLYLVERDEKEVSDHCAKDVSL